MFILLWPIANIPWPIAGAVGDVPSMQEGKSATGCIQQCVLRHSMWVSTVVASSDLRLLKPFDYGEQCITVTTFPWNPCIVPDKLLAGDLPFHHPYSTFDKYL